MTPTPFADGPMDLSIKTRRKLRLEEFLRQNLDQAPAGRVIQWVNRDTGVFRILWTHQSSGAFTQDDAALFRYWALARGKPASLSSVELKQSLRMALNKSPSVVRLSASHDEYRYFRFTEWESRRSASTGTKSPKTLESVRKKASPASSLPPLLPYSRSDWEYPSLPRWTTEQPDLLKKNEGFTVPNGEEPHPELPVLYRKPSGICWGPEQLDLRNKSEGFRVHAGEEPHPELPLTYQRPPLFCVRDEHLGRSEVRDNQLAEQAMGQYLMEKQARKQVLREHLLATYTKEQFSGEELREKLLGDQPTGEDLAERQQLSGEIVPVDSPLGDPSVGGHLSCITKTHSPQAYLEAKETQHSVPSYLDSYSRTDFENHLSLYGDAGAFPKLMMNYDHRLRGTTSPYFMSSYDTALAASSYYNRPQALINL